MHITWARLEDAPELLALQRLAYQSEAALYGDYTIPPLTQSLAELQADFQQQRMLKGMLDGQLIGSVRAAVQQETCYIGRLIVHPAYQRRGFGSLLLREIERRCQKARRYELFTGHCSQHNIRLYERQGYRIFKHQQVNERLTLVFLEKYLSEDTI